MRAAGTGLIAFESGTRVTARKLQVRDTQVVNASSALRSGTGILVADGATLDLAEGWFENNGEAALRAETDTVVRLSDLWMNETQNGVVSLERADITIERARIHADKVCVTAGTGAVVRAFDLRLSGTGFTDNGNAALYALSGGRLEATRVSTNQFRGYGLFNREGHSLLEDVSFDGIEPLVFERGGAIATAVLIIDAPSAELNRVRIGPVAGTGISLQRSSVSMQDIEIEETMWSEIAGARAIVLFGGDVQAERVRVSAPEGWGIDMYDQANLTLSDYEVRSAGAGPFGWGVGLHARSGSQANVRRAHITNAMGVAVWAAGVGSRIEAQGMTIETTRVRECARGVCESQPAGVGVGAYEGAAVELSDFQIDNATLCGVQVGPGSDVDLSDGRVSTCGIGACVHAADYVVSRLTSNVAYEDNGLSIDTVSLPIPEAPELSPRE